MIDSALSWVFNTTLRGMRALVFEPSSRRSSKEIDFAGGIFLGGV
jgi:hypothetical protein